MLSISLFEEHPLILGDSSLMSLLQMSKPHVIVHSSYCPIWQMSIVAIVQCVNRGIFSNINVLYDDSEA